MLKIKREQGIEERIKDTREKTKHKPTSSILDPIIEDYEEFLEDDFNEFQVIYQEFEATQYPIDPSHLEAFIATLTHYESHRNFGKNTGVFLNSLIKNLYNNNHKDLSVDTTGLPEIWSVGSNLNCKLLTLSLLGVHCLPGSFSKGMHFIMREPTVIRAFGFSPKYCIFTLKDTNPQYSLEKSFNTKIDSPSNCTFRVYSQEMFYQLQELEKNWTEEAKSKVQLLDSSDSIITQWMYSKE